LGCHADVQSEVVQATVAFPRNCSKANVVKSGTDRIADVDLVHGKVNRRIETTRR
jgi:hypothetical protein